MRTTFFCGLVVSPSIDTGGMACVDRQLQVTAPLDMKDGQPIFGGCATDMVLRARARTTSQSIWRKGDVACGRDH